MQLTASQLKRMRRDAEIYSEFKELMAQTRTETVAGMTVELCPRKTDVVELLRAKYGFGGLMTVYRIIARMEALERMTSGAGATGGSASTAAR